MSASVSNRIILTGVDADRALIRDALRRARRDGWTARYPKNRRDGGWTWVNPGWLRNTRPPSNAKCVSWDGVTLTVQVVNANRPGWLAHCAVGSPNHRAAGDLDAGRRRGSTRGGDPMTVRDVTVQATAYTVSVLPETHFSHSTYAITVEYRGPGSWAVVRHRWCLGTDCEWDFEPIPSERDDDWLKTHRFPLDQAIELAKAAAPHVCINGATAAQILAELRGRQ